MLERGDLADGMARDDVGGAPTSTVTAAAPTQLIKKCSSRSLRASRAAATAPMGAEVCMPPSFDRWINRRVRLDGRLGGETFKPNMSDPVEPRHLSIVPSDVLCFPLLTPRCHSPLAPEKCSGRSPFPSFSCWPPRPLRGPWGLCTPAPSTAAAPAPAPPCPRRRPQVSEGAARDFAWRASSTMRVCVHVSATTDQLPLSKHPPPQPAAIAAATALP